jgi:hypothetical protein
MDTVSTRVVAGMLPCVWLLVVLAACNAGESDGTQPPSGGHPQLVLPGTPANVVVQLPAKAQQSYVHGSYAVCLDEPGEVKVTTVKFQSGALEVTGWGYAPFPSRMRTVRRTSPATCHERP